MRTWTSLLIATPVAVGLLAAPAAHADWRNHRGWGGYERHHDDGGGALAGAMIGLGIGALIGGAIVASQPHYYAPPPPVAYMPPPPPPGYYYATPSGY